MAQNAKQQLLDLLVTKNFEPQTLDSQGKPAPTPDQASVFSFDYKGESGKDYGTVVVMITDGELTVYSGDNTGKAMEGDDKNAWFGFLQQLKNFAVGHFMSFGSQNLNKLKYSMQGQAALNEGLFEGWSGNKTNSWNGKVTEARLMIKHKKTIGENDARYRYIESLFIETADGERFKLPFTKLSAGKAMLEHVRQGGKPYDIRGNHIVTIVTEMNLLNRFRRASQNKIFEGETAQLVEQATHYYESLQHNLKSLSSKTGYKKYFESWDPTVITDEDVIIEDLRHMFVEQNIDSRIEQALPLLAKLKQQDNNMKEAEIFESMMNLISEGTWALPDTKEKQMALVNLLSQELPVGADATNATEQLYDLLGDDELFDKLHALAQEDANADARNIILDCLEELKSNPDVAQVIGQLTAAQSPAADEAQPEEPVQEGFNTYDMDNTPCPKCHEKELTYFQGTNHVKCGACGKNFSLAGKPLEEVDEENIDKEIQRISELSSGTLKNYIKKASGSSDERSASNLASRAAHKLSNPEGDDDGNDDDEKSYLRSKGIARAVDRLEETDKVKLDPKTGKPTEWSHEGDWQKSKNKDPRGQVTHMSDVERRKAEKVAELDEEVKDPRTQTEDPQDTPMTEAGDVMFKDQERLDRLESLRGFAKAVGNTAKAEELDRQIKAIYAANPVGSQDTGHLEEGNRRTVDELSDEELDSCVDGSTDLNLIRKIAHNTELTSGGVEVEEFAYDFAQAITNNDSESYETNEEWGESIANSINELLGSSKQISELGTGTLKSYVKKASSDRAIRNFDQGFDAGKSFDKREPDFDEVNARHDDNRRKGIRKAVDRLEEGGMSEADLLLQDIARGDVDIYNVYANPKSSIEQFISKQIHEKYDDIVAERGLHPDDDVEQILQIIQDQLVDDYGVDEGTIGKMVGTVAGTALAPSVPGSGIIGGYIGDKISGDDKEMNEGTALQGQYGHSGKMESVKGIDQDMMDRIKFLAGITK